MPPLLVSAQGDGGVAGGGYISLLGNGQGGMRSPVVKSIGTVPSGRPLDGSLGHFSTGLLSGPVREPPLTLVFVSFDVSVVYPFGVVPQLGSLTTIFLIFCFWTKFHIEYIHAVMYSGLFLMLVLYKFLPPCDLLPCCIAPGASIHNPEFPFQTTSGGVDGAPGLFNPYAIKLHFPKFKGNPKFFACSWEAIKSLTIAT